MEDPAKISDIVGILKTIISLLAPAAGIAFFIMFLVGGFKFITAGNDSKAVESARSTLTFAIVGVVLVVVSWLLLRTIQAFTGVNLTTVSLPKPN